MYNRDEVNDRYIAETLDKLMPDIIEGMYTQFAIDTEWQLQLKKIGPDEKVTFNKLRQKVWKSLIEKGIIKRKERKCKPD